MTSLVEALIGTATSRRKLLLAGTTLAAASTFGSGWSVRSALAQAHSEPKPTPEQMKEMGDFTNATATQLALYAQPLVAMYLLRHSICFGEKPKAAPGEIWRIKDIVTPTIAEQAGYVTPNANVIYGFGFLDLGREPVILTVPNSNNRYYMVEICDMWTNALAYAGGVATGYKGGTFALVGPRWKGRLPAGVTRIDAPTRWVEVQPRVHVKNQADLPGAQKILDAITVKGLSAHTGGTAPAPVSYDYPAPKINPRVASSMMDFNDPVQFWEIFSSAMNENPPPAAEVTAYLPQFKHFGFELGRQWKASDVNPLIVDVMKRVAANVGAMSVGISPMLGKLANGWIIPPHNMGLSGADFPTRAAVAALGLTSNTTKEAIYYTGLLDANNEPMTGTKKYTITFKEPMHYLRPIPPGFWALTMYDSTTKYTVPNPINRYSLGSDDEIKKNADGSFTVYLQHEDPGPDKKANWLPAPAGPFYVVIRNFAPVPDVTKALLNPATFVGPPPAIPA